MSVVQLFLWWPQGELWPNLFADAVTFVGGWAWAHRRAVRGIDDLLRNHQAWVKDELDRLRRDMDHSQVD